MNAASHTLHMQQTHPQSMLLKAANNNLTSRSAIILPATQTPDSSFTVGQPPPSPSTHLEALNGAGQTIHLIQNREGVVNMDTDSFIQAPDKEESVTNLPPEDVPRRLPQQHINCSVPIVKPTMSNIPSSSQLTKMTTLQDINMKATLEQAQQLQVQQVQAQQQTEQVQQQAKEQAEQVRAKDYAERMAQADKSFQQALQQALQQQQQKAAQQAAEQRSAGIISPSSGIVSPTSGITTPRSGIISPPSGIISPITTAIKHIHFVRPSDNVVSSVHGLTDHIGNQSKVIKMEIDKVSVVPPSANTLTSNNTSIPQVIDMSSLTREQALLLQGQMITGLRAQTTSCTSTPVVGFSSTPFDSWAEQNATKVNNNALFSSFKPSQVTAVHGTSVDSTTPIKHEPILMQQYLLDGITSPKVESPLVDNATIKAGEPNASAILQALAKLDEHNSASQQSTSLGQMGTDLGNKQISPVTIVSMGSGIGRTNSSTSVRLKLEPTPVNPTSQGHFVQQALPAHDQVIMNRVVCSSGGPMGLQYITSTPLHNLSKGVNSLTSFNTVLANKSEPTLQTVSTPVVQPSSFSQPANSIQQQVFTMNPPPVHQSSVQDMRDGDGNVLLNPPPSVPSYPVLAVDKPAPPNNVMGQPSATGTPINIPVIIIQTTQASNLSSTFIANATTTALNSMSNAGE